jgi:hypothetical protein
MNYENNISFPLFFHVPFVTCIGSPAVPGAAALEMVCDKCRHDATETPDFQPANKLPRIKALPEPEFCEGLSEYGKNKELDVNLLV